jgi:phosphoribosylamine--glycine ligase
VLHAGTLLAGAGGVVTSGGRVLSVVGTGPDLATARERAYAAVGEIRIAGSYYRTDIAADAAQVRA